MLKIIKLILKSKRKIYISIIASLIVFTVINVFFEDNIYMGDKKLYEYIFMSTILFGLFHFVRYYTSMTNGSEKELWKAIPVSPFIKMISHILISVVLLTLVFSLYKMTMFFQYEYLLSKYTDTVFRRDILVGYVANGLSYLPKTFRIIDILSFAVYSFWFFLIGATGINLYNHSKKKKRNIIIFFLFIVDIFYFNYYIQNAINSSYAYQNFIVNFIKSYAFHSLYNHYQPLSAFLSLTVDSWSSHYSLSIGYLSLINASIVITLLLIVNIVLLNGGFAKKNKTAVSDTA